MKIKVCLRLLSLVIIISCQESSNPKSELTKRANERKAIVVVNDSNRHSFKQSYTNKGLQVEVQTQISCNSDVKLDSISKKLYNSRNQNWYFANYCDLNSSHQALTFYIRGKKVGELSKGSILSLVEKNCGQVINGAVESIFCLSETGNGLFMVELVNVYNEVWLACDCRGSIMFWTLNSKGQECHFGDMKSVLKSFGLKEQDIENEKFMNSHMIMDLTK